MNSKNALNKLIEGNSRFVKTKQEFPNVSAERREKLTGGQKPFAVIISCSDSRVPPEVVFDQGLGDLFIIRNAGNVIADEVTGSVEYALAHLGTPLVVILGHSECGAVKATMQGADDSEAIKAIVARINPAIDPDSTDNSIMNNIRIQAEILKKAGSIIPDLLKQGKVEILGGYYSLKTGEVEFFEI